MISVTAWVIYPPLEACREEPLKTFHLWQNVEQIKWHFPWAFPNLQASKKKREVKMENNSISELLENSLKLTGWKITSVHIQRSLTESRISLIYFKCVCSPVWEIRHANLIRGVEFQLGCRTTTKFHMEKDRQGSMVPVSSVRFFFFFCQKQPEGSTTVWF